MAEGLRQHKSATEKAKSLSFLSSAIQNIELDMIHTMVETLLAIFCPDQYRYSASTVSWQSDR